MNSFSTKHNHPHWHIFSYSYEACFKGEIVLPGTVANHPSNRMIVQSTEKPFFLLLTYRSYYFPHNHLTPSSPSSHVPSIAEHQMWPLYVTLDGETTDGEGVWCDTELDRARVLIKENDRLHVFKVNATGEQATCDVLHTELEAFGTGRHNGLLVTCGDAVPKALLNTITATLAERLPRGVVTSAAAGHEEATDLLAHGHPTYPRTALRNSRLLHRTLCTKDGVSRMLARALARPQSTVTSFISGEGDAARSFTFVNLPDTASLMKAGLILRSIKRRGDGVENRSGRATTLGTLLHENIKGHEVSMSVLVGLRPRGSVGGSVGAMRFASEVSRQAVIAPCDLDVDTSLEEAVSNLAVVKAPPLRKEPQEQLSIIHDHTLSTGPHPSKARTVPNTSAITTTASDVTTSADDDAWACILSAASDDNQDPTHSPVRRLVTRLHRKTAQSLREKKRPRTRQSDLVNTPMATPTPGNDASVMLSSELELLRVEKEKQDTLLTRVTDAAVEVKEENIHVASRIRDTQHLNTRLEYDLRRLRMDYDKLQGEHVALIERLNDSVHHTHDLETTLQRSKKNEVARLRERVANRTRSPTRTTVHKAEDDARRCGELKLEVVGLKKANTALHKRLSGHDTREVRERLDQHHRVLEVLHERVRRGETEVTALREENLTLSAQAQSLRREASQAHDARDALLDVLKHRSAHGEAPPNGLFHSIAGFLVNAAAELNGRVAAAQDRYANTGSPQRSPQPSTLTRMRTPAPAVKTFAPADMETLHATGEAARLLDSTLRALLSDAEESQPADTFSRLKPAIAEEVCRVVFIVGLGFF